MYLLLFGVGLLITAAGFVTIGFGIPINAFSLGNTLIIAGTVAVVGGLVLIGLAAAVRQLNRVAQALQGRALERAPMARTAPAEASDSLVPPTARLPHAPTRGPVPPKPAEVVMPRPPEPRAPVEPRFPDVASPESPGPLDWLRPKPNPAASEKSSSDAQASRAEPPVMEVPDEAPLSPRAPQRPLFSPPPLGASVANEPPVEPKAWTPSRGNGEPEPTPKEARPEAPSPRSEQVMRMTPSAQRARETSNDSGRPSAKETGLFDVVWPDARSKLTTEPAQRETKPEPAQRETKPEPAPRPREEARGDERAKAASERPSAILKSGVIDGMAYTLYADGSIEAELPQGTVRFASVDALRAHLEKSV